MSITRVPISMLNAGQTPGNVTASGNEVRVETSDANNATSFDAVFDNTSGVLTLSVPGYPIKRISGFDVASDLGNGVAGQNGIQGRSGVNGLIGSEGEQGPEGCMGPRGPIGATGPRGQRGVEGDAGSTGPTGATGEQGKDGTVLVFVQEDDPGAVGAKAFWVKPQYTTSG